MDNYDHDDQEDLYNHSTQEIEPIEVILGVAGGLMGAGIGGAIWLALVIGASIELGLLAIGIGVLAGMGVERLSGRHGLLFQIIAAACALSVFFATKAVIVLYAAKQMTNTWFEPSMMGLYQEAFINSFGLFDLVWIGLVGYSAWAQLSD